MKEEIRQKLGAVVMTLNNIQVKGKANMSNMVGSISVLEDLYELFGRDDLAVEESRPASKKKGAMEDGMSE